MIAGDATLAALVMPDNNAIRHRVEFVPLAEVGVQFGGFLVHCVEIGGVCQPVFAYLETDMGIVDLAFRAGAAVPTAMIPWQGLVGCDTPVSQLADKSVNADLPTIRFVLILMVIVLVPAE